MSGFYSSPMLESFKKRGNQTMNIADKAKQIVCGDREKTYGDPAKNLRVIGKLWASYLELDDDLSPEDVTNMMILLKISRLKNTPGHEDSMIDIIGYTLLQDRIQEEKRLYTPGV